MAKQLQVRRGTTMANNLFTGAEGEITMDTVEKGLRVHDGSLRGGYKVPTLVGVQYPSATNNYTWYRKYSDGWVEQGGISTTDGSNPTPITLPVEMVDANYIPFIQGRTGSDGYSGATWQVMPVNTATSTQTSTKFYAQASITGYNLSFGWRVEGMAA